MTTRVGLLLFLLLTLLLVLYKSYSNQEEINSIDFNDQYISSYQGNYIMIYTPSLGKPRVKYFDGGPGINTVWLRLTDAEINDPQMEADLLRFCYFIINYSNLLHQSNLDPEFTFQSFPLSIRNFENLIVERISDSKPVTPIPVNSVNYPFIRNSSLDCLV